MVQFWCSFGAVLVQFLNLHQKWWKLHQNCTTQSKPHQNCTKTAPELHHDFSKISRFFQNFQDIFFQKFQDFSKKINILSIFCDFSVKFRPLFYIFSRFFGLVGRLSEVFLIFPGIFFRFRWICLRSLYPLL